MWTLFTLGGIFTKFRQSSCYYPINLNVHSFGLQELSKIAMPIVFNEPLSFLQRISEYMEHTHLIHEACALSDSIERMQVELNRCSRLVLFTGWCRVVRPLCTSLCPRCQVVAAFAVSAVASQWDRTGKPFNPLLGETYELTRYCRINVNLICIILLMCGYMSDVWVCVFHWLLLFLGMRRTTG